MADEKRMPKPMEESSYTLCWPTIDVDGRGYKEELVAQLCLGWRNMYPTITIAYHQWEVPGGECEVGTGISKVPYFYVTAHIFFPSTLDPYAMIMHLAKGLANTLNAEWIFLRNNNNGLGETVTGASFAAASQENTGIAAIGQALRS